MKKQVLSLNNKEQYDKALRRMEEIFNADQGTPEFEELNRLARLIAEYEEEHFPVDPPETP